jgi:hypothetical protein
MTDETMKDLLIFKEVSAKNFYCNIPSFAELKDTTKSLKIFKPNPAIFFIDLETILFLTVAKSSFSYEVSENTLSCALASFVLNTVSYFKRFVNAVVDNDCIVYLIHSSSNSNLTEKFQRYYKELETEPSPTLLHNLNQYSKIENMIIEVVERLIPFFTDCFFVKDVTSFQEALSYSNHRLRSDYINQDFFIVSNFPEKYFGAVWNHKFRLIQLKRKSVWFRNSNELTTGSLLNKEAFSYFYAIQLSRIKGYADKTIIKLLKRFPDEIAAYNSSFLASAFSEADCLTIIKRHQLLTLYESSYMNAEVRYINQTKFAIAEREVHVDKSDLESLLYSIPGFNTFKINIPN